MSEAKTLKFETDRTGTHGDKTFIIATDDPSGLAVAPRRYPVYVDRDDLDELLKHHWHIDKDGYVTTHAREGRFKRTIRMHRLILKAEKGQEVDHENGIRRDNRRDNLRLASRQQQVHNTKTFRDGGVSLRKDTGKWRARITLKGFNDNKEFTIGHYETKDEAKSARDDFVEQKLKELGHDHETPTN
jgi:hypothetical protein